MKGIPSDIAKGLNVAERIGTSVYGHIKVNRAHARTVAVELRENIELIKLYAKAGSTPVDIIPKLSNSALGAAITAGFSFVSLRRSKIGRKSIGNKQQLNKYVGWSTQKSFERLYSKISVIKHAAMLPDTNGKIRLGARLNNLFRFMIMLARHIEA